MDVMAAMKGGADIMRVGAAIAGVVRGGVSEIAVAGVGVVRG
jgi:hypothetical protein